jgi:hypothetical protein
VINLDTVVPSKEAKEIAEKLVKIQPWCSYS